MSDIDFEDFPEKWACKGGKELEDFFTDYKSKYKNYINATGNATSGYYILSSNKDNILRMDLLSTLPKNYTEVTVKQLREHYLNEKTMKKIIAYKLIKEYPGMIGELGRETLSLNSGEGASYVYSHGRIDNFTKAYFSHSEYWEPVYEKEEKVLKLGSNNVEITVGVGKIAFRGYTAEIERVQKILNVYTNENNIRVGQNWEVKSDEDVKFIRIGCLEENNLFSISDLKLIIREYKKLN